MPALFAYLHYLALALGFSSLLIRTLAMRERNLGRIFLFDNLWGLAALLWIGTGLMRAFGGLEKGSYYYLHNHWFFAKMGIFLLLFLLELYPMITLIKWRIARKAQLDPGDELQLKKMRSLSHIELMLLVLIPLFATLMARGGLIVPAQ